MTSEGSAHGRFQRAVSAGLLLHADAAARELRQLSLVDALAFLTLLAEHGDQRFERAASRWRLRLDDEAGPLALADAHLATAALLTLRNSSGPALLTLIAVLARYGVPADKTLRPVLVRWNDPGSASRLR